MLKGRSHACAGLCAALLLRCGRLWANAARAKAFQIRAAGARAEARLLLPLRFCPWPLPHALTGHADL